MKQKIRSLWNEEKGKLKQLLRYDMKATRSSLCLCLVHGWGKWVVTCSSQCYNVSVIFNLLPKGRVQEIEKATREREWLSVWVRPGLGTYLGYLPSSGCNYCYNLRVFLRCQLLHEQQPICLRVQQFQSGLDSRTSKANCWHLQPSKTNFPVWRLTCWSENTKHHTVLRARQSLWHCKRTDPWENIIQCLPPNLTKPTPLWQVLPVFHEYWTSTLPLSCVPSHRSFCLSEPRFLLKYIYLSILL